MGCAAIRLRGSFVFPSVTPAVRAVGDGEPGAGVRGVLIDDPAVMVPSGAVSAGGIGMDHRRHASRSPVEQVLVLLDREHRFFIRARAVRLRIDLLMVEGAVGLVFILSWMMGVNHDSPHDTLVVNVIMSPYKR